MWLVNEKGKMVVDDQRMASDGLKDKIAKLLEKPNPRRRERLSPRRRAAKAFPAVENVLAPCRTAI